VVRVRAELAGQGRRIQELDDALADEAAERGDQVNGVAERLDRLTMALNRTLDRIDSLESRMAAALRERVRRFDEGVPPEQRLQARVGIHLGEVRIDRGDVFGEPVNIAARIEALAGPGEVLFGESVWLSMNRAEVRAEDAGERELKGVPEPIRVFRLLGALSRLPELGPLPSPDGAQVHGEISRHLRAAAQAAARQAEDALPKLPDKVRVFVGAGLAAMMAVATAFFALARLGALP